jgi:phage head maturation protease
MKLTTRKMPLTAGPKTMNSEARQVQAVMATENPVRVYDWDLGIVEEVLLMSGASYPEQVPLLDSHDRSTVETVLGSVSAIKVQGLELLGLVEFSSVPRAQDAMTKVQEGHLTDFSVGYAVEESVWIPEGQSQAVDGRNFQGPVKVATKWTLRELSITPIGADSQAKARSLETNMEENKILERERSRVKDIMGLGQEFDVMDQAREAVEKGQSVQDFQAMVLKGIRENKAEAPGFRVEAGETDGEKFRSAAQESILVRGGLVTATENDLAALTLRELARECLIRSGQRSIGRNLPEMIGRALTSSDFPKILAASANKSLLMGYETSSETWMQWCATGNANDFKTHSVVRPSEMSDLEEVAEMAEYTHGTRSEEQEQFQIATYGKLFAISRQAIINDDLGALTTIPQAHGEAAGRKVGDVAYVVLTGNETMGDGKDLFHSDHSNLAGTGGAVSVSTLAAGIAAMRKQKDILGLRSLNIRPQFFIAPVALEGSCEQLFLSNLEGTQAKPGQANPYAGNYFVRVYDPRLDDDDANAWYLAGPKGKTVTVFFLNGNQVPYLESREGFNMDGVEYKVRIDCGAKAVDWRALYKNDGGA